MAAVGESRITYDARGLVEIDGTPPGVAEIDGDRATFDARELTIRKINAELRRLVYEEGVKDVTIANPGRGGNRIERESRASLRGRGLLTGHRPTLSVSLQPCRVLYRSR